MSPKPSHPLLDALWRRFEAEVPYARTFVELAGGDFTNDHIALRSLKREGSAPSGIELFAPVFERLGWVRAGSYVFHDTDIQAIHLSHPRGLPRIFVSEVLVEKLTTKAQQILTKLPPDPEPPADLDALGAWFAPQRVPLTERELLLLGAASQYAAWVAAFGRKVNHFTAAVTNIERWAERLRAAGVPMKEGIEGDRDSGLRQTATQAAALPVPLEGGGSKPRPYAYFEIAERKPGFDGFLVPQARNLFDLTK
jgi:hypothetical protein